MLVIVARAELSWMELGVCNMQCGCACKVIAKAQAEEKKSSGVCCSGCACGCGRAGSRLLYSFLAVAPVWVGSSKSSGDRQPGGLGGVCSMLGALPNKEGVPGARGWR